MTLARLLMARARAGVGTIEVALALLARILAAAEAGGRSGTTIEVLVLQALAYGEQGNTRAATAALNRALSLAEPEGYARVFIDEGAAMAALLAAVLQRGSGSYARRLLGAIQADGGVHAAAGHHRDELSERERDVIRLLATELSGPDIARELVVSLNTLRTHTKSIYSKLGVSSRRAAVRRATELGFL